MLYFTRLILDNNITLNLHHEVDDYSVKILVNTLSKYYKNIQAEELLDDYYMNP